MSLLAAHMTNTDYDDLNSISVVPGGSNAPWNDDDLQNIRRYSLSLMDSQSMVLHGGYVFDSLNNNMGIDTNVVMSAVYLASNLRDPDAITSRLLVVPAASRTATITTTLPTVRATQAEMTAEERAALNAIHNRTDEGPVQDRDEENPRDREERADENLGSVDLQAAAYAYICAYLMRLQCRSTKNVAGGLRRAVERFKTWYEGTTSVFDTMEFSIDALGQFKDAVSRKPELTSTWVLYLSTTENTKQLMKQSRGMLEYLGLQVFSYQGMHALTQVLALHQLSKIPLRDLLMELDSPLTRDGLKEIANIIRNHERTSRAPDRTTYFRYARVWDTKYFAQLQSKTCIPLLYVAAVAVRDASPNASSDPTQIYALQNIGATMKQALDRVAAEITKFVVEKSYSDARSGKAWEAASVPTQDE